MVAGPLTLKLRYSLDDLDEAEARFSRIGVPFMVLAADGLGRTPDLSDDLGEVVFWPRDPAAAAAIIQEARVGLPPLRSWDKKTADAVDWVAHWRRFFHWTAVSPTLAVGPPWEPAPPEAAIAIRIDPGEAFGTGTHPTSQLSLGFLEEDLRARTGTNPSILDVGCGSGILCIGARLLGAGEILGLDVDEPALDECARNALLNETPFRATLVPVADLDGAWDLVVANILPNVLVDLAPALAARVAVGGRLILSGVPATDEDFPERFIKAAGRGWRVDETRVLDGWWAGRFFRELINRDAS